MLTIPARLHLAAPLLACLLAGTAWAATPSSKVTYLAGAMVYADVGSLDGLQTGDSVQVVRAGVPVALVKVTYLSSHRAACDTLWTRGPVALGDDVVFRPHALPAPAATAAAVSPPAGAAAQAQAHRPRIRGRVGARWLSVDMAGTGFRQPALDLRFDGRDQGNGHVDVAFDMRNRRTFRTRAGASTTEQVSRVYRAALTVRSLDSHRSLSFGRQSSASLASVSLFDGVVAQSGNDRHSFGLFSGTQPNPASFGLSRDILESGGFVEFHSAAASQRSYQVSLGAITSQDSGQANRDFLVGTANWSTRVFMSTIAQEVDFNRGWKRAQGERAFTPTSTFWTARVAPVAWLGLSTGFDNRRSVRLWRDRVTPADQFDDTYRQGAWVGSDVSLLNRFRLTGETRGSGGADHSHSWSAGAEAYRISSLHVSLRGRVSEFTGANVTSRLWSGSLGLDPTALSHIEASGGVRGTRIAPAGDWNHQNWTSLDLDLTLGRRWYLNGGYERDYGGNSGDTRQVQAGLNWRF
jgi:hypothetical protein